MTMMVIEDRVMETTTTTGTGDITLAGAVSGFRSFSSVCATGDVCHYLIEAVNANGSPTGDWETGYGTYSAANTLTRTLVYRSSNSNAAVSFAAGTKRVSIVVNGRQLNGYRYFALQQSGRYMPVDSMNFGASTGAGGANLISFLPFSRQCIVDAVVIEVTSATASGHVRGGIYTSNEATGLPDTLIEEGAVQSTTSTGIKAITFAAARAIVDPVWVAILFDTSTTCRTGTADTANADKMFGSSTMASTGAGSDRFSATFTYAALPATTGSAGVGALSIGSTTIMHALRLA